MNCDDFDHNLGDYENPFPGMSDWHFLNRTMNPADPMYMGPEDEEDEEEEDNNDYYLEDDFDEEDFDDDF